MTRWGWAPQKIVSESRVTLTGTPEKEYSISQPRKKLISTEVW